METICGISGCKTGYLKVLVELAGMLKGGKFAEGDGRESHPGDCAGGEIPMKLLADVSSPEFVNR